MRRHSPSRQNQPECMRTPAFNINILIHFGRKGCSSMAQSRRGFFGSVLAILAWLVAPFQSRSEDPAPAAATGVAIPPDDGEHLLIGPRRAPVTIKVGRHNNSSRMAVGTENIAPGDRIPIHKHGREDEIIFIHSGEGTMTLGEERIAVKNEKEPTPLASGHRYRGENRTPHRV
jgi:Cupin domain